MSDTTRQDLVNLDAAAGRIIRTYTLANQRVELRAADGTDAGILDFEGYASITEHGYEMWGGPPMGWTEIISRGAFKKTLSEKPDVQLLVNHGGLPLARTKSGTLHLSEDEQGLLTEAGLLAADPDVQRLEPKMRRGDIDEMSFAFWVVRQRWENEDGTEADDPRTAPVRRILEVNMHKGDVSIVNYGANDATFGAIRDLDRALMEARSGRLTAESRDVLNLWLSTVSDVTEPAAPVADFGGITLAEARARLDDLA